LVAFGAILNINTTKKAFVMRVGFHYHIPAYSDENGAILMPSYFGVFIDSLAREFGHIVCFMHSPVKNELSLLDYSLKAGNVTLVDIGPHVHMFKRVFKTSDALKRIKPEMERLDYMLIRGPSPLLPAIGTLCRKRNVPVSMLLVGDYLGGLEAATTMHLLKKAVLRMFYKRNKDGQDRLIGDEPLFVNSKMLYDEYRQKSDNCVLVNTTTLSEADFFKHLDTCQNDSIRLLFTGRIDPTKGIEDIFHAVALLKTEKKVYIDLAGWETSKGFLKKLDVLAEKLGLADRYVFHGKKSVGPELFSMYKQADIYVIASRGDFEGFPRTLWEAMAHSTPIVATEVGGIPHFLTDRESALLVESNAPAKLAKAIETVIDTPPLRKKLIAKAYDIASTNTLEKQASKMYGLCEKYLIGVKK